MTLEVPGGCAPDNCSFPRVEIGDEYQDPAGLLLPGMEVMLPCEKCGMAVNDYMDYIEKEIEQHATGIKLLQEFKNVPLFHWSPAVHRKQISRYGLRPNCRPTTHAEFRAPYICFADDPVWAWALSGNMSYSPGGEWDLWQTWFNELKEPDVLMSSEGNGVHEYRTDHRVYKRSLKFLGSRYKD